MQKLELIERVVRLQGDPRGELYLSEINRLTDESSVAGMAEMYIDSNLSKLDEVCSIVRAALLEARAIADEANIVYNFGRDESPSKIRKRSGSTASPKVPSIEVMSAQKDEFPLFLQSPKN